jgi:hypothetical protein
VFYLLHSCAYKSICPLFLKTLSCQSCPTPWGSAFFGFEIWIYGFTVQDYDNAHPASSVVAEQLVGTAALAKICRDYAPGLGGTNQCQDLPASGNGDVGIARFGDLKSRPDIQALVLSQNKIITTQDLFSLELNLLKSAMSFSGRNSSENEIMITSNTDITPNKKLVDLVFQNFDGELKKNFMLFTISPDQNTEYLLASEGYMPTKDATMPHETQQVFSTFEALPRTNMTTTTLAG